MISVKRNFNHTPGKKFKHSDGMIYEVMPNGAWKRITARRCNRKLTNTARGVFFNNGIKRRIVNHNRSL